MGTRLLSFFRSNAIGLLALFIALGGTGYAAIKINGKNIKNGTITGKKLKKHTLTGKQINLSKLGKVRAARNADNALALGGTLAAGFLKTGCGPGKVNGYAAVHGSMAGFPASPTSSAPFIDTTFNCSGQAVSVSRVGMGNYRIVFPGNPAAMGFANVRICTSDCTAEAPPNVEVTRNPSGTFEVTIQRSGTTTFLDRDFDVLVL